MDTAEFERRADQLARQLEDMRDRVNEFTKDYRAMVEAGQGQVRATARQTRENVADALSELRENPRPWWIPVGVVVMIVVLAILAKNFWGFAGESNETRA
jgi:hypothetical protein